MFRKDYFRGAKGIIKGRLSWKHIQDDIYAREKELEKQDDIIDEEKLFYMGKQDFDKMISISRAKEQLKKKQGSYRESRIIFEFMFRLVISQGPLNYMEQIGIDLKIDERNMDIHVINEMNEQFNGNKGGSVLEIKQIMEKMDVFRFGILMDIYHLIRQQVSITNDKTYI
jgi:hypothetical protein